MFVMCWGFGWCLIGTCRCLIYDAQLKFVDVRCSVSENDFMRVSVFRRQGGGGIYVSMNAKLCLRSNPFVLGSLSSHSLPGN